MHNVLKASIFLLAAIFTLNAQAEDKKVKVHTQNIFKTADTADKNMKNHDPSLLKTVNTALLPVPKLENDFYNWHLRHEQVKSQIKKQPVDVVFIGDSITHMFGGLPQSNVNHGGAVWDKYYSGLNVVNMGFGWDRTQNVLWRLDHGEFEGIQPKVTVLLIGTNNLVGTPNARENTPAEIAAGISAICDTIHAKAPDCKIILLGVLPRGQKQFVKPIQEINKLIFGFEQKGYVTFLNFGQNITGKDGLPIKKYMLEDGVHPNERGYQVWAESMDPVLKKLLQ